MLRLVIAICVSVAATLFAAGNMHRVEICPFFGEKVEIRLFFLIASSFVAGGLVTVLVYLYLDTMLRKRVKAAEARKDEDDDEFFSS